MVLPIRWRSEPVAGNSAVIVDFPSYTYPFKGVSSAMFDYRRVYIINLVRVWEPGVFLSLEPQQNYLMGWHEVWLVLSENAVYPTQLRPFHDHAISINYNPTIRRYLDLEGLAIIFRRSQLAFISSPCLEAWVRNAIGLWFFLMKYWGRASGWSRVVSMGLLGMFWW